MAQTHKKLLIIGFVWPEPSSTAAGGRVLQLIQFFVQQNYQVTFASTALETAFTLDLEALGVNKAKIILNDIGFDVFIKKLKPQIVLFDRFMTEEQFGWRVAQHLPDTIRILDTEDLHSLRYVREKAYRAGNPFSIKDWLHAEITKREVASIYRSDLSLIISSYELKLLQRELKIDDSLLLHLPFMLKEITTVQTKKWTSFAQRTGFVCIGNGKHTPNIDAILWLKEEIWPLIRSELPNENLFVYGAYLPLNITQLHRPSEGFHIMGRAQNAMEVIGSARVSLAPLRFGAGIKGKLTDAMITGTPSITTPIGAEGMHGNLPWAGEIAENTKAFAKAAISLYTDEANWHTVQQNGIEIINSLYSAKKLGDMLLRGIEELQNKLAEHRTKNFIGSLLQHHTTASTKYMAKWIEAKNKRSPE
ncbi:glycosyltransferase [Spongiimicrobium sp. 3-5]|uniref:glycosyltransferase n=1 Tax=Spongiimicrobium sp. 3-5 TaxID=3332596 RepID=UPI003980D597